MHGRRWNPTAQLWQDLPTVVGPAPVGVGPLIGRDAETELLASLIDATPQRGAALNLRGDPGIGKSRLLTHAASLARERGMTVLSMAGVQAEAQLPFAGLHQLLRPVRDRALDLLPEQRATLDAAFGLGGREPPPHWHIAMAALDLLCEAATSAPLLAVVDDTQWLDRETTDVLAFIARRVEADPILILTATRDGYPGGLIELSLTAGSQPAFAQPGLVSLTQRLERAFAARLADLPEDTRLLLLVATLNDCDGVDEVLAAGAAVAGSPSDLAALEPAVEAALIDLDVNCIRFRHPLMRSAVRQSAGVQQRRRVHEALAATLDDDPDRRVWHRAALINGTHEELASELEQAGARARRRGAIDVAVTALRRAVQLSAPGHRARRMFATAELAYERGRPDIALAMLREIERLDLGLLDVARVRFLSELMDARAIADHARVAGLIAIAEQAGAAGDRELHHNLLWVAAARTWWASPGPDIRQLVVAAADRAGPPAAADPRLVSIHAYADPHANEAKVLDCLRDAADGAVTGAAPAGYLASAGMVIGAFYDSLTFCTIAIDAARAEGRLGVLPRLLATQAILAVRLPDWDIAIPAAEEARRLATELGQPIWLATAETAIAMIAAVRGDPDETERATARAEQIALPLGATHLVALAQSGPIVSALAHGRHAEALRLAERLFDPGDPAHHLQFACMAIGDLAEAASPAGRSQAARERGVAGFCSPTAGGYAAAGA